MKAAKKGLVLLFAITKSEFKSHYYIRILRHLRDF